MPSQPVTRDSMEEIPLVQRAISILWPSFLTAAAATVLFFVLFDPRDLAELVGFPEMSRLAGYTGGFFGFWLLTSISSALTCYFRKPCHEPVPQDQYEEEDVEQ